MSENYVGKNISDKLGNQRKFEMYVLLLINGSIICPILGKHYMLTIESLVQVYINV